MSYVLSTPNSSVPESATLPAPPAARKRSAIPIAAAIVPMLGGVGMYVMTNSVIALMFAALGPVMLVATLLDGARVRRADLKRYKREIKGAVVLATKQIDAQHHVERELRWRTHPDLATLTGDVSDIWRVHPQREGTVVVGSGTIEYASDIARGIEGEQAQSLREYAAALTDAPLVIVLDGGICVRAQPLVAKAVVRALVIQLCSTHGPDLLRVVLGEGAEDWLSVLPHVRYSTAQRIITVTQGEGAPSTTALTWCLPDQVPPLGCRTVLELGANGEGFIIRDSLQREVRAEAISQRQATAIAEVLAGKSADSRTAEPTVFFAELMQTAGAARVELPVVIGRSGSAAITIDIVADGPHAVVVGTTGSGKSELLVSWALALCAAYTPDQVTLLLADFKGGTAFDPLANLPHVTGILTDLNGALAKRAMLSLQAEIRRREGAIASVGARDITDVRVALPRLIIMVDEFAALVRQLPELDAVFTDIAARGRALGMHLIMGAQRAAGVIRDATLANAPLRIALRVTDSADSRAIIGSEVAAQISGGPEGKGVAFVRRAADATPQRLRCALSTPADVSAVAVRSGWAGSDADSWWAPLPTTLDIEAIPIPARGIAIGIADDTENLRRVPVVIEPGIERGWWVLGGPRSGKSSLSRLLAQRHPGTVQIPADLEGAWDALVRLEHSDADLVVWDDVDAALASWPDPWNREATERLERLIRAAGSRKQTWVLTAQRASGQLSRIADLLPGRVLFAVPSKLDHVAAGGGSQDHDPQRPPGRALMAGVDVQFALAAEPGANLAAGQVPDPAPEFVPERGPIGIVARGVAGRIEHVRARWGERWQVLAVAELQPGTVIENPSTTIFIGDAEQFQRAWSCLELVKNTGSLVIASDSASDVRILTGDRTLPPYAGHARWWQLIQGAPTRRVRM